MPEYLKIIFILTGILVLIRFRVTLSVTLLLSAAVLGFFSIFLFQKLLWLFSRGLAIPKPCS